MQATGKITHIENGKDGYTATIENNKGVEYITTISIVNLAKSGSTYKRYEVGETITVKGTSWRDNLGITHITAQEIK